MRGRLHRLERGADSRTSLRPSTANIRGNAGSENGEGLGRFMFGIESLKLFVALKFRLSFFTLNILNLFKRHPTLASTYGISSSMEHLEKGEGGGGTSNAQSKPPSQIPWQYLSLLPSAMWRCLPARRLIGYPGTGKQLLVMSEHMLPTSRKPDPDIDRNWAGVLWWGPS